MAKYEVMFEVDVVDGTKVRTSFKTENAQVDIIWDGSKETVDGELEYLITNLFDLVYTATIQLEEQYEQQKENLSTPAE